ncbi:MAG: hypothetical protein HY673_16830 [Chloroflexi bacterium]|nr:hypothetical protein [Chloroflexota bacterium]
MRDPKLIGAVLVALVVLALVASPLRSAPVSLAAETMPPVTPSPTPTPPPGAAYVQLPLSADIELVGNPPDARVRVTVTLPSSGFEIAWGQATRMGTTITAETRIWQVGEVAAAVATPYAHDYGLGNIPAGRYLFVLKAWGRMIGAEIITLSLPPGVTPTPSPTARPSPTPTGTPGPHPIPSMIIVAGRLVKLQVLASALPIYNLITENGQILALRSELDLEPFVDKEVVVGGYLVSPAGTPPVLQVLKIGLRPPPPTPRPTPTATPKPTLTPIPPVTPTPTVTPRPTPVPRGTAVVVGSAHLALGKSVRIPVTVKNITAPGGLAVYDFTVRYNPAVIRVDDVVGGMPPFDTPAAKNIVDGRVFFNGLQTGVPGPKGDIIVAYLVVTAVATTLSTTPLDITINTLADPNGVAIPAAAVRGWVSVLPTNTEAVVRLSPAVGPDRIAVINLLIDRVRNTTTNGDATLPGGAINFTGQATFNPDRINIVGIRGTGAINNPISDVRNDLGTVTVGGSRSGTSVPGPVIMTQLVPRITGSVNDSHIIGLLLDPIEDGSSSNLPIDTPPGLLLKRGDANNDGRVDMIDALWIAQFSVGVRTAGDTPGDLHPVNAASVKPDGDSGDRVDMTDALFIAQYKVGLRDENFELVR